MILDHYRQLIENTLKTLIPKSPYFSSLYHGANYALLTPGKRIRPLLTLSVTEMINSSSLEAAIIPACALEMVHTYSLIHDDLPCMDDDDLRRGQPTLHKVYSEGHAVLMGDYLLTHAFKILSTAPLLSSDQKISLIDTLSSAAGGEGMIGGQIMDIEKSPHIEMMHTLKTAALFRAAVIFGGIICQADSSTMTHLDFFGTHFGQLFQIVDDILDGDHPRGPSHAEQSALLSYQATMDSLSNLGQRSEALCSLIETIIDYKKTLQSGGL